MNSIIQKFNLLKFRTKLTILLCFVGLVPIAILGLTLSFNAHDTVRANRKDDMRNSLQQASAAAASQVAVSEQMLDYLAYDQNVIGLLENDSNDEAERDVYYQEVCGTINTLEFQNQVMRSVTIYSENIMQPLGEEVQPIEGMKTQKWYPQVKKDTYSWIYDSETLSMIVVRRLPKYLGEESFLVANCNIQSLLEGFGQLGVGQYAVKILEDKNTDEMLAGKTDEKADESADQEEIWNYYENKPIPFVKDSSKYIWEEEEIPALNLKAVYYTQKEKMQTLSWETYLDIFVRLLICVVVIVLLGRKFSDYISKPLELLTQDIQSVDSDNMEVAVTTDREDEIGILIKSYKHMMQRIQDLIQENYQTKIAQKEFEMKALQAQINPHFLYNSLSVINWKAIEAKEKEISRITLALSSFYRTTLNRGKTMNTIKNAVENIKSYLAIQLCMHDNNFEVHYEIDEETYGYYIPSLIFQPFVENSLEHGLDIKEDPDHQIWIKIDQTQEDIFIEIADNGVGMSQEETVQILNYDTKGYGVKNVNDRMLLHYGPEYPIQVESIPNVRTSVTLRIPKAKADAQTAGI